MKFPGQITLNQRRVPPSKPPLFAHKISPRMRKLVLRPPPFTPIIKTKFRHDGHMFGSRNIQVNPTHRFGSKSSQSNEKQEDQHQQQQLQKQLEPQFETVLTFSEWFPLVALVFIVLILNGMVCYLYRKHKNIPKKLANVLLLNQACIDLFSGIAYIPVYIASFYLPETDYLRSTVCMYSILLSICGLFLLAVERLWSILSPLQHLSSLSRSTLLRGIILTWLLPLPIGLINLVWAIQQNNSTAYTIYLWVFWVLLVTVLLITAIVYVVTFIRTGNLIHKKYARQNHERKFRSHSNGRTEDCLKLRFKQELRVTWLAFVLFLFYIIGYYPTVIVNLLAYLEKYNLISRPLIIFTSYSYVLNGIFNPFLCLTMKQDYKNALLEAITYSRPRPKSTITFLKTIKISSD